MAVKTCLANGQWYKDPEDIPWNNYSLCELSDELITRSQIAGLGIDMTHSKKYSSFEAFLLSVSVKSQKSLGKAKNKRLRADLCVCVCVLVAVMLQGVA